MDSNERMDHLQALCKTIAEGTARLNRQDQHEEQFRHLKELTEKHDAQFNALVQKWNEMIRGRGEDKQ